jgi:cyclohexanecarboxylate-CoA ligase
VWRDGHLLTDLVHWAHETPEAIAVYAHTAQVGATTRLSYSEYARYVERFAGALHDLGVRPGQVVAIQLPNWWQAAALMLACIRAGAVIAPIMPTVRPRELERVLRRLQTSVCVTTDRWADFDHSANLAELAPRLPHLRHRVVLGQRVAEDETNFSDYFERTPWEQTNPMPLGDAQVDPDRVALALFTSGTTGEPKAALHTLNTHYATARPFVVSEGYGPRDRFFTPHALMHSGGIVGGVGLPLLTGGAAVLLDAWEPSTALGLMADVDCSMFTGAPVFLSALVAEVRKSAMTLPALRTVLAPGTTIPRHLVMDVAEVFALPLRNVWGMTEAGGTHTRAEDPSDWAAHSVGRPGPGTELDLRSEHQEVTIERPARLYIRGGSVCLATMGRDTGALTVVADHDDGWYHTGDLAVPDGRDGIQVVGRAADRVGGVFMIPVNDVENALLQYYGVNDAAVVGYPDDDGGELACAVIVCEGTPTGLAEIQNHLKSLGMTEWYWPSRVENIPRLPRTSLGKVRKELLKRWLQGKAELTDD